MKRDILFSNYEVSFRGQTLKGVLLKEGEAYSLLQPWPGLGDPPLAALLEDLRGTCSLSLSRRALQILDMDLAGRREGRSLLPLQVPPSHLLLGCDAQSLERIPLEIAAGVEIFKFKIGVLRDRDSREPFFLTLEKLLENNAFRIRLDANLQMSRKECYEFFSSATERFLNAVDFVEDPFGGTAEEWRLFKGDFSLRVAHDFADISLRSAADVWVLKPSREDPWPLVDQAAYDLRRVVITSSLDHPLGHLVAAWEASRISSLHPLLVDTCGLISFEELGSGFPFHRRGTQIDFGILGPTGFGIERLLGNVEWSRL